MQLSLTSASFAFFNIGSFFSFSSRCLSVLLRRLILLGDGRVSSLPDLSAPPISLVEQFHGVLCLQIKLDRNFARPHGENFSTFDLRDRSRKYRGDTGKFSYRTSAIHIDPTFLSFFSSLDIFCVPKYFGKYLWLLLTQGPKDPVPEDARASLATLIAISIPNCH